MRTAVLSVVPLVMGLVSAWTEGECPKLAHNTDHFIMKEMTGLWFEYVWTEGFTDGNEYRCSSWTMLEDKEDKPYVFFNH